MIYKFNNQEERKNFGGSAYCKTNANKVKKVIKNCSNWNDDSLYISNKDIDVFLETYSDIFGKCICQDLKEYDRFDTFGINYYSKDRIDSIKEKLLKIKPKNYELMLDWLNECDKYNGFYILGI